MSKRKQAEEFILKQIDAISPGNPNVLYYQQLFATMNDRDFDNFMKDIGSGKKRLQYIHPNMSKHKITVKNNIELAEKLGHSFYKRIWLTSPDGKSKYLTPHKHLVYELPIRRQAQLLVKKIAIPEDNNTVDAMTGQPTGGSKSAKISFVELQIMSALGLAESPVELIKYRGGDTKGFNAMNTLVSRNGSVSMAEVEPYSGGVTSTQTLKCYLTAAHLESTLP